MMKYEWLLKLFYRAYTKLKLPPSALILETPKPADTWDDEVFGSRNFGSEPSKDWRQYRPVAELQSFGDCVTFSRLNCAETIAKIKGITDDDGKELNFSDLWLAVKSDTTERGNSLNKVSEVFRKTGAVLEQFCPYTRDWNERAARVAATVSYAKKYLGGNHAWVKLDRNSLKNALEEGPIQIGVGLGETYQYNDEAIRPPKTIQVYHAIMCDYIDGKGQLYCYDHYNRMAVVLSANYPVAMAKTFKDLPLGWQGTGVDEQRFYSRLVGKFVLRVEANGELYEVFEDKMIKVTFMISNIRIWDAVHKTLRPMIVGITEADFKKLEKVAFKAGGIIE